MSPIENCINDKWIIINNGHKSLDFTVYQDGDFTAEIDDGEWHPMLYITKEQAQALCDFLVRRLAHNSNDRGGD